MKFITNYGKSLDDRRVVRWPAKGVLASGVDEERAWIEREKEREAERDREWELSGHRNQITLIRVLNVRFVKKERMGVNKI